MFARTVDVLESMSKKIARTLFRFSVLGRAGVRYIRVDVIGSRNLVGEIRVRHNWSQIIVDLQSD